MRTMRAIAKKALRPFAAPLIHRLRLWRGRIGEPQAQVAEIHERLIALRGANENLTRAWLAQEAELRVQRAAQEASQQAILETRQAADQSKERAESIERRLQQGTSDLLGRLEGLRGDFDGTRTRVDNTLKFLLERVEFVRREVLFEVQHGGSGIKVKPRPITSRVANPERISEIADHGLRLNIGCGHIPLADYVNVDMRDLPGVDIVAEAGAIDVKPASVTEIFSAHLLEHFPEEALKRRILPHWTSLLCAGGRLRAVVPDGDAMIHQCASGEYPFADFREVLFGAQDYQGDFHFNLFTPESLSATLTDAGYTDISVPARGRRNGRCFEFEISAKKP